MSEALIYKKMTAAMKEIGAVAKSHQNPQQGYSFRAVDDVVEAVRGALVSHGIFFCPAVEEIQASEYQTKSGATMQHSILRVRFSFYAEDGSSVEAVTTGEGSDSGDKACNKALSGALKYALTQTFAIPTGDPEDDSEADSPKREGPSRPRASSRPSPEPPASGSGAFDRPLGFGKFKEYTWRQMTEGEIGGRRHTYLEWLAENADKEDLRNKAQKCLRILNERADRAAADDPDQKG